MREETEQLTWWERHGAFIKQIIISLIAITGGISSGLIMAFSSAALPQLTDATNPDQIYLTPDQASWFASLNTIASPFGCLICGPLSDRYGRKMTLLVMSVPYLVGWILLATVTDANLWQLYSARIFQGFSAGMSTIPASVYLAEIASNTRIRSMLTSWTSISITLGVFIAYVLGSVLRTNWQMIAVISGSIPLLSLILTFLFLPESPMWLIGENKPEQALKSLRSLRGVTSKKETPTKVQKEYDAMIEVYEAKKAKEGGGIVSEGIDTTKTSIIEGVKKEKRQRPSLWSSTRSTLRDLGEWRAMKPLLIMCTLFMFQQISGYIVITYYAVDLLKKAGVEVDPYWSAVFIGAVQFLSGSIVSVVLTRFGRRPMGIIGGAGQALCMIGLGLNMQYKWMDGWFPLTTLTILVIFSMIGFRTVPWSILGEVYPLHIKGMAVGITTCVMYIFSFATIKIYPFIPELFNNTESIFYIYGATSTLGTIFVVFFQPETHRKSLEQIQLDLHKKKKNVEKTLENPDL